MYESNDIHKCADEYCVVWLKASKGNFLAMSNSFVNRNYINGFQKWFKVIRTCLCLIKF